MTQINLPTYEQLQEILVRVEATKGTDWNERSILSHELATVNVNANGELTVLDITGKGIIHNITVTVNNNGLRFGLEIDGKVIFDNAKENIPTQTLQFNSSVIIPFNTSAKIKIRNVSGSTSYQIKHFNAIYSLD